MDSQTEQTTKLPIKRHLVRVRKSSASPLQTEDTGSHHFQHLHDTYLHEVDGEDCYECPLDLLAQYCAKHRADFPRLTALLDIAANRGLHHRMDQIQAGIADPQQVFYVAEYEEKHPETSEVLLREPAQSFVKTAEGKTILPLPIHDVAIILGHHHHFTGREDRELHQGGQKSLDAIAVIVEFLAEVGLAPNQAAIRRSFCKSCRGG